MEQRQRNKGVKVRSLTTVSMLFFCHCAYFNEAVAEELCCQEAICFEKSTESEQGVLQLVGCGTLSYLFFKVYSAAFYAEPRTTAPVSIAADKAKRLEIHYLRSVDKEDFIEAADEFLRRYSAVPYAQIEQRVAQLNEKYESVKAGDRYVLEYWPAQGTTLFKNGKEVETIEGKDFAQAYFAIWLSEDPLNEHLRDALTGK